MQTPDTPENWNAASRGYADNVAPVLMESFMDEFLRRLEVEPTHEVLEVAAGSGALTSVLADKVKSVLATDFAPAMLEIVRERMAAAGAKNVSFEVMDGQALALQDATFDRAACSFAMMLFPDRSKGFREMRRVLRPGGRAMVSAWAGPDRFEGFGLFLAGLKSAYPDMPPPPAPPPVFSLADPTVFKEEMEAAGFKNVEVDFVTRDLQLENFDSLWKMFTVGAPPVQMLLDRLGPDSHDRLRESLAKLVESRFGRDPIRMSNAATVGTGTVD